MKDEPSPGFAFRPRLLATLKGYSRNDFAADLIAGFTVGIVALPLAMAFGIASGVDPKAGLVTAIIAGFVISLLGGSKVQIGGPTGAFVGIVYAAIVRTATNVKTGARSPIAGMIHAVTLLLIVLIAAPLAKNIPLA